MDSRRSDDSAERFSAYLGELASVIGHAARVGPLRDYCLGLLLPCERKSVEPIAAATAPQRQEAAKEGGCPRRDRIPDQAENRDRADRMGVRGRYCPSMRSMARHDALC